MRSRTLEESIYQELVFWLLAAATAASGALSISQRVIATDITSFLDARDDVCQPFKADESRLVPQANQSPIPQLFWVVF